MLFPLLNYSQKTYPQIQLIDKDTVCVIGIDQVKKINTVFTDVAECNELNDSLQATIVTYDLLVKQKNKFIASQNNQLGTFGKIIEQKDVIIGNDSAIIINRDKKIKKLILQRNVLAVLGIVFIGVFGVK